jgi:AraC-like DNA-binding protein
MDAIVSEFDKLPVPRLAFDTRSFRPEDRLDAWRENMGVFFDLSAPDGGPQRCGVLADIEACSMAGTVFGVTTSEAQLFERSENRMLHDQMEHFLIQVFLKGGGTTRDGERVQAGDMLIIDLDQPHAMVTTDFSNLTLVLPRELNPELTRTLSILHARRLPRQSPMIGLLASHLEAMWNSVGNLTVQDAGTVMKGTVGLMACWLADRRIEDDDLSAEVSSGLGKAIMRHIDGALDQALTPESLAATFRVSRSQLYRIFKPHGGVSHYIWERRMTKSMRMLANPMFADLNVSAIAFSCGFSSEPHFSRSFKERFGVSPSQFRKDALQSQLERASGGSGIDDQHRRFATWIRQL